MVIGQYDPQDTVITVDGVNITALGEDMVTWEKEEANFEAVYGAQGDAVESTIHNDGHNMTITVLPSCPQLSYLISLFKSKKQFPVWATNKKLGDKGIRFGGNYAKIKENPEIALGAEAESLEISFFVFDGVTESATK